MFAEHGQHSFIEYLWTALKYLFVFSDAFRWTNATASTKSFFFETYTRARILGSDIINLWGSDPGFRFCRARNLAQQGKVHWKSGVVGWDFVGNARSDLTHVCDLQNPSRRPRHPYWREGCSAFLPSCLPAFLPCMHACVHACIHDTRVHARRYHLFTFQVSLETRTNKTSECGSSARKMCLTITYDNVHERAIQRLLHLCVFVFFWEVVFSLQSSHANLTSRSMICSSLCSDADVILISSVCLWVYLPISLAPCLCPHLVLPFMFYLQIFAYLIIYPFICFFFLLFCNRLYLSLCSLTGLGIHLHT